MRVIPVLVYSRVVGYVQCVQSWNKGKKAEFEDRKETSIKDIKSQLVREQAKAKTASA